MKNLLLIFSFVSSVANRVGNKNAVGENAGNSFIKNVRIRALRVHRGKLCYVPFHDFQ